MTGFDPGRVGEMRMLADNLKSWFDSMTEQRNDWQYQRSVEVNAVDALQASYRLASAVYQMGSLLADFLEASAGEAGTAETGNTGSVHEHAVPNGETPK